MGNVKARGVGEMTLSIGVVVTGSATATSRAWTEVSGGDEGGDEGVLTLYGKVARADGGHDCFFVVCTRVRSRERKGNCWIARDMGMIKRQVKARQAWPKKNAQDTPALMQQEGERWVVARG
jgi:hypothetical protein